MSDKKPVPPSLAQFALEQLSEAGEQAAIDLTVQDVEILRAEIERRDARIVELEARVSGIRLDVITQIDAHAVTRAELAAMKAQQPSAGVVLPDSIVDALKFYADGDHLLLADHDAWDTCSGEPMNFLHDEAGTASVEDGSIAKAALARLNPCRAQSVPDADVYRRALERIAFIGSGSLNFHPSHMRRIAKEALEVADPSTQQKESE